MANLKRALSRRSFTVGGVAGLTFAGEAARAAQDPPLTAESPLGPFYPLHRLSEEDFDMTLLKGRNARAQGTVIEVTGRVLDKHGRPMSGARIEIWQANAAGRYAHDNDPKLELPLDPNFQGFASLKTGSDGTWRIRTVKPAAYDSEIGLRPPHIHFDVRGLKHRLTAQMYFPEDAKLNAADLLFQDLRAEAPTAVAVNAGPNTYNWDIVLMDSVGPKAG